MKRSIKTTVFGVGAIMAALGNAIAQYKSGGFAAVNFGELLLGLSTGVGLIVAKDFNVSGAAPQP